MHRDDLDSMLSDVKAAALEAGSHVVDAILSLESSKVPVAGINPDATATLIRAVRPRVVYCSAIAFDAAEQILADLFDDEADRSVLERPRIKRLVAKWRERDGQTSQITGSTMVDGILHGFIVEAPWYGDFEADVEAVQEERDRIADERVRKIEADAKKRLGPMVDALMADARFSGPKVGNAKRTALAGSLFPDLDRATLNQIVDMAESRHWLATGR